MNLNWLSLFLLRHLELVFWKRGQKGKGYFLYPSSFIIFQEKTLVLQIIVISTKYRCSSFPIRFSSLRTIDEYNNLQKPTQKKNVILSKLSIKAPQWCQWRCSGIFMINFEQIWDLALFFLLLTQVNAHRGWLLL